MCEELALIRGVFVNVMKNETPNTAKFHIWLHNKLKQRVTKSTRYQKEYQHYHELERETDGEEEYCSKIPT